MRLGQSERETATASSLSSRPSREERAVCPNKSSVSKPNWTSSQQYLYFTSNTVESSSSSSSSFRGAISTRSAGVVIMSYFLVFLILLPDLKHKRWGGKDHVYTAFPKKAKPVPYRHDPPTSHCFRPPQTQRLWSQPVSPPAAFPGPQFVPVSVQNSFLSSAIQINVSLLAADNPEILWHPGPAQSSSPPRPPAAMLRKRETALISSSSSHWFGEHI